MANVQIKRPWWVKIIFAIATRLDIVIQWQGDSPHHRWDFNVYKPKK